MNSSDIDVLKGDLRWCAPPTVCQYNVAILINEYRKLPGSSTRYYIGSVLRDMQINVESCFNDPPQIVDINDTCIVAGSNLSFDVKATDSDIFNTLTLTATGGPFNISPTASFNSSPSTPPVTGAFNWTTNCTQIRLLPYLVTFKVTDDSSNPLVDFESVFIRVIAPAPKNLTSTASGSSITLNWDTAQCNSTLGNNQFIGYSIYRKNACDTLKLSKCETGVPGYTGYTKIGTTSATVTTFIDNDNGQGLINGIDYSYVVVANYSDGSQSYASKNVCQKLIRDVPIITNVSVLSTGTNDSIWVHWIKPVGTNGNLDTVVNPPPYEYRLLKATGLNPNPASFLQIASYTYPSFSALTDTGLVSNNLNTQDSAYSYRVDFYSDTTLVGSTRIASSVFLSTTPTDNAINLTWKQNVPWDNYNYEVYRETSPGSAVFTFVDSTTTQSYIDTGLVNGQNYCYKIISIGKYSDHALPRPLYNTSQINCNTPIDRIPPCQPDLTLANNCETEINTLTWKNPNTYCSDDGMKYYIYYANTTTQELTLIDSILDINDTSFTHQPLYEGVKTVAGCYAVTAIDSTNNESPIVTKKCVDNCPIYQLPNVFTPNNDGNNDFFKPLIPYRYIKDIDMKIYNRWGTVVFETKITDILWDGKNINSKKQSPDGVYFYICIVNEIYVDGIVPKILKGYIQLIND